MNPVYTLGETELMVSKEVVSKLTTAVAHPSQLKKGEQTLQSSSPVLCPVVCSVPALSCGQSSKAQQGTTDKTRM
ncbi:MAG TPA: hypothetical protein VHM26_13675 [Chitinophagaceae bacterium]|nr:hypothetical protein [Chitinophagaceae bacterium]